VPLPTKTTSLFSLRIKEPRNREKERDREEKVTMVNDEAKRETEKKEEYIVNPERI